MEYPGQFSPCLNVRLKLKDKMRRQKTLCINSPAFKATFASNLTHLHHTHIPEHKTQQPPTNWIIEDKTELNECHLCLQNSTIDDLSTKHISA